MKRAAWSSNFAARTTVSESGSSGGRNQQAPAPHENVSNNLFVGDAWPNSCVGCNPLGAAYPSGDNLMNLKLDDTRGVLQTANTPEVL